MDCTNGIILVLYYGHHHVVDFKYALMFAIWNISLAATIAESFESFLIDHENKLRGGVGFVPFFMSLIFLTKGILTCRKNRKLKQEQEEKERMGLINSENDQTPPEKLFTETPENSSELKCLDQNENPQALSLEESSLLIGEKEMTRLEKILDVITWKSPIMSKVHTYVWLRLFISWAVTTILATVCGLIYFGGGIVFSTTILVVWNSDVKFAAGTGSMIMALTMFSMSFTFIGRPFDATWQVLILRIIFPVVFTMIGAVLGVKFVMKVQESTVFFCVFAVLMSMGILSTLDALVIDKE